MNFVLNRAPGAGSIVRPQTDRWIYLLFILKPIRSLRSFLLPSSTQMPWKKPLPHLLNYDIVWYALRRPDRCRCLKYGWIITHVTAVEAWARNSAVYMIILYMGAPSRDPSAISRDTDYMYHVAKHDSVYFRVYTEQNSFFSFLFIITKYNGRLNFMTACMAVAREKY